MEIDPIAVQRVEREATMVRIVALPLPEKAKGDVYGLWQAVQEAVNAYVRKEDRWIDERVLPATLRLMADEHERIVARVRRMREGGGDASGG